MKTQVYPMTNTDQPESPELANYIIDQLIKNPNLDPNLLVKNTCNNLDLRHYLSVITPVEQYLSKISSKIKLGYASIPEHFKKNIFITTKLTQAKIVSSIYNKLAQNPDISPLALIESYALTEADLPPILQELLIQLVGSADKMTLVNRLLTEINQHADILVSFDDQQIDRFFSSLVLRKRLEILDCLRLLPDNLITVQLAMNSTNEQIFAHGISFCALAGKAVPNDLTTNQLTQTTNNIIIKPQIPTGLALGQPQPTVNMERIKGYAATGTNNSSYQTKPPIKTTTKSTTSAQRPVTPSSNSSNLPR